MAPEIVSDDDSMEVINFWEKNMNLNVFFLFLTRSSMERKLSGREER